MLILESPPDIPLKSDDSGDLGVNCAGLGGQPFPVVSQPHQFGGVFWLQFLKNGGD
jgi:hypothetical protein